MRLPTHTRRLATTGCTCNPKSISLLLWSDGTCQREACSWSLRTLNAVRDGARELGLQESIWDNGTIDQKTQL